MNAYTTMKKLIDTQNRKYENGRIDEGVYTVTAETYKKRIDVFYANGRLSDEEYSELMGEFKSFE